MNYSDEELQRRIERKDYSDNSFDAVAYQKVFDALKQEPYRLPADFADRVALHAPGRFFVPDHVWLSIGLLAFVVIAVVLLAATGLKIDFSAFRLVFGYSGIVVFAIVLFALIQYFDRRLVTRKMSL